MQLGATSGPDATLSTAAERASRKERGKRGGLKKKERLGKMENISVFDLVVTVLLATATFWGGLRGVVSQISAIATWILSGLAAARYGLAVGETLSIPEPWRAPVSALIVFCAAALALSVATRFVKRAVSLAGLKEFDRQTGALFGFFKGCAICVVLTFFCVLASEKTRDLVDDSKSGPYLASVSLLLKSAFPESETMTRFEALVATMESTQAKGGAPTLNAEIADLETYLKDNVLSQEAADVVEEAETGGESKNGAVSSKWSRFLNDLRGWRGAQGASNEAGTNDGANYIDEPNDYSDSGGFGYSDRFGGSSEYGRSGTRRDDENGEVEESDGVWGRRSVWESRGTGDVRGGAANDGYYSEYREDARWEGGYGREENVDYDDYYSDWAGESAEESGETSNGWVDLTTFLTHITGGARSTLSANGAGAASSERRTANYAASPSESLNDFLGVPASANANARSATPTFDVAAPRTTDGAILGRPIASPTPLIPPPPY